MRRITAMDLLSRKQMGVSGGEQGSVLVIALLFASILTIMGVSFLTIAGTDVSIVFNETNQSQAFYLGEAGIAEATRVLRDSNDWDIQLGAPQPFPCPGMVPIADGGCTFRVENDAADPGGPANDTNDLVVVRATGTFRNAAKEVDIGLTRLLLPFPPGGLTSIGSSTNISFAGNSFDIDGNNWIPPSDDGIIPESQNNAACTGTAAPKFGIAVPDAATQLGVKNDLTGPQQDNVLGANPNPPWAPVSTLPSIGVDTTITQAELATLTNYLIPMANITYSPGTQISSPPPGTLGTQADPKIVVVDATGYSGSDPALTLSAAKGAGILIVKNGSLKMSGNSQWVGIVIVIGNNVEVDMRGGGDKSIYGSVLLAENLNVATNQTEGDGNVKVRFSCQGIDVANTAGGGRLRGATVWWREVF
ncbi:MAG TPA: pilus assembly PilX N-terminal domain-containing protein [Candidatus Methylomirabilis sp.]|nr:pilus assembly PilX N-terminal domain-containing protein [Candidatus Methylomirabilis sp.]